MTRLWGRYQENLTAEQAQKNRAAEGGPSTLHGFRIEPVEGKPSTLAGFGGVLVLGSCTSTELLALDNRTKVGQVNRKEKYNSYGLVFVLKCAF
jgi:hypothetical protein